MSRQEFPQRVRVEVIKRATHNGIVICEKCGALAKRWQIDHVIADSHGGKSVLENAELICEPCYSVKNPLDTKIAAKLKRVESFNLGAKAPSRKPIRNAGFMKKERAVKELPELPRRPLYR